MQGEFEFKLLYSAMPLNSLIKKYLVDVNSRKCERKNVSVNPKGHEAILRNYITIVCVSFPNARFFFIVEMCASVFMC